MNVVASGSTVAAWGCALPCVLIAALAARAPAIVPPTDCGRMTVKDRSYVVKADQLLCRTARSYASRAARRHHHAAA